MSTVQEPTTRTSEPTLHTVPKSKLLHVLHDLRDRSSAEYRDFEQRLIADIAERGVQVPLIGHTEGESVRLIDGETRFRALLLGPRDTAPVLVYATKPSEAEVKLAGLLANSMRHGMTPLEYARTYAELMKLNGWSQAELARHVHVSPAHVAKCLAISSKLCPEVQEMVAAGDVPPRAGYAISRCDPTAQVELARKVKDGLLCVEGLEAHIAKLNGKKVKQKPLKLSLGSVAIQVTGNVVESLRAFVGKASEALKRLEKDNLPPDVLPSLLRS